MRVKLEREWFVETQPLLVLPVLVFQVFVGRALKHIFLLLEQAGRVFFLIFINKILLTQKMGMLTYTQHTLNPISAS